MRIYQCCRYPHLAAISRDDGHNNFRLIVWGISSSNEVSVLGDYYKSTSGEYEAHLVAKDRGINLVDITLSVPVEETAAAICDNWQKKNQEIYKYLITELFESRNQVPDFMILCF